jgi:hypothetical protein
MLDVTFMAESMLGDSVFAQSKKISESSTYDYGHHIVRKSDQKTLAQGRSH